MEDQLNERQMSAFRLGNFILHWHVFECVIEVAIRDLLRLSNKKAHTVLGALQFQAKASILKALLNQRGAPNDAQAILLVKKIISEASRNAMMHGLIWFDGDGIEFVKREVADRLVSKHKRFGYAGEFQMHIAGLEINTQELARLLGVSNEALFRYRKKADSFSNSSSGRP